MGVGEHAVNPDEIDEIAARVAHVLRFETASIHDIEDHDIDHEWVKTKRRLDETRIARNEAIIRHLLGWGAIAFVTGIGTIIWNYLFKGNHGG